MTKQRAYVGVAVCAMMVFAAQRSLSADYFWLASPASGAWNTTDANWSGAGSVWVNGSGNSAFFNDSGTTAVAADPVTLQHAAFGASGYTISGGPLLMYGSPTVSNGVSATISATLTNVGVWAKSGPGLLTLSPGFGVSNMFYALKVATGTLHVASGTSLVTQNGSSPESSPLFWVTGGGTMIMGGGLLKTTGNMYSRVSEYGKLLVTNGVVDLWSNSELLNGHNTPGVVTVSDGGTLIVQVLRISQNAYPAAQTVININTGGTIRLKNFSLDASSARSGTVNFNGGMIVALDTVNQLDMLGTTSTNWRNIAVNVLRGGAIINNNGCNIVMRQNMIGSPGDGGLTKLNSGVLYLRNTNTYNGATSLKGGTLNVIRDHNLGAVPASPVTNILFLANSTLQSSDNHALDANRTVLVSNLVTATIDSQAYTQTIRGAVVGAETNAVLLKVGSGMLILDPGPASGINIGTLRCMAGTLAVISGTNYVTAGNKGQNQPGVWVTAGTLLVGGGMLKATQRQYINLDGGALVVTNGLADFTAQDEILNGIGASGWTTVSGSGVLDCKVVRISQNWGNPSNAVVNVNTGGVLRLNNFYIDTGANQKGLVNLNGGTVVSKASTADFLGTVTALTGTNADKWLTNITVNVLQGGAIFDFALENHVKQPLYGAVPNDGGLTKRGVGAMLLANTNTYAGGTRIEGGTLRLGAASETLLAGSSVRVGTNATFDVNGKAQALGSLGGSGTVANNALLTVAGEVAPGDAGSYGTLTLAAACPLSGAFKVDVAATGACDRLHVAGNLDVSALALQVADVNALNKENRYVIATCTGGLSGTFISDNLPPRWMARYDVANKQIYLVYNFGTLIGVQ
jgi:autotransporter-associated beta strand protein